MANSRSKILSQIFFCLETDEENAFLELRPKKKKKKEMLEHIGKIEIEGHKM